MYQALFFFSLSSQRSKEALLRRGWPWRFCWSLHMVSKSPHNCLCSTWTCWCTSCIDPYPGLTTWGNFCESGFFCVPSLCHSSQTRTYCSHFQQSLNCICTFYGKEHEASYGARRLPGKVGNDCTWGTNQEWPIPGVYLCFYRYRMAH